MQHKNIFKFTRDKHNKKGNTGLFTVMLTEIGKSGN